MSAIFKVFGSSSGGNCALLQTAHTKILLDAGFTAKRIGHLLEEVGESIDAIDAVFLTHEHTDHAQGLRGLAPSRFSDSRKPRYGRCRPSQTSPSRELECFRTGTESSPSAILPFAPFSFQHDAQVSVGFRISWGKEGDLRPTGQPPFGSPIRHVPTHVFEQMKQVDAFFIEANYDDAL